MCHDVEKLGSTETKGKKRKITKQSASGRAQGTLAPRQNVLSDPQLFILLASSV